MNRGELIARELGQSIIENVQSKVPAELSFLDRNNILWKRVNGEWIGKPAIFINRQAVWK